MIFYTVKICFHKTKIIIGVKNIWRIYENVKYITNILMKFNKKLLK